MKIDPASAQPPHEVFRHCPHCGSRARAESRPDLRVCADCELHVHFNPAAAVAGLLFDDRDRLLMTVRRNDPYRGFLDLPGGFVDFGESAEEALRREILEEISLKVGALHFKGTLPNTEYRYRGLIYQTTDLFFEGEVEDWSALKAADETEAIRFVKPSQLKESDIAFVSIRRALRQWYGMRA